MSKPKKPAGTAPKDTRQPAPTPTDAPRLEPTPPPEPDPDPQLIFRSDVPVPGSIMGMRVREPIGDPLLPRMSFDEWAALRKRVKKEGSAQLSSSSVRVVEPQTLVGGCIRSVICRTTVVVARKLRKKKGQTRYVRVDVGGGTFLGPGGEGGGVFVEAVIQIEIKVSLAATKKKTTEANDVVKAERRQAGKRFSFKGVTPLEFILIHEELHAADLCASLSPIAQRLLTCGPTAAQKKALDAALRAEFLRIVDRTKHGEGEGADSAVEEDIRRRTWEEWDRRQPNYQDP